MIESVEETLRAAEKRVEICEKDLARAEAVLVGVKLVISALQREQLRRNDERHEMLRMKEELFRRHLQGEFNNEDK